MGITGLLPFVKRACREGNLLEFQGRTIAVDVSCLLHKGVFGCADKIAKGKETDFYVHYVKRHVNLLLKLECHVILVFDGQPLPAKKNMNDIRKARREKNQKLGVKLMSEGLTAEANRAFRQGVTITRDVVEKTIKAFQKVKFVDVIVAPFEADAQIAYLLQKGLAHAAVTEDSDLIAFGCKTIIFKLDNSGSCMIYEKSKLPSCVCPAIQKRFDFRVFLRICILAGCDYLLGGLQGVGLRKAEMFFAKTTNDNLGVILPRLPMYLSMSKKQVNKEFVQEFIKAEKTFLHQIVFDPMTRQQTPLNPYPDENGENDEGIVLSNSSGDTVSSNLGSKNDEELGRYWYAGKISPASHALRQALGNISLSGPSIQDMFVLPSSIERWSIWSYEYLDHLAERNLRFQNIQHEKFGAFTVTKSTCSAKRPRAPLIDVCNEDDEDSFIPSKKRFSEPILRDVNYESGNMTNYQKSSALHKNGSTMCWNRSDWIKIYGIESQNSKTLKQSSSPGCIQELSNRSFSPPTDSPSAEKVLESRSVSPPECLDISTNNDSIDFVAESPLKSPMNNFQSSVDLSKSPKMLNPFSKKSNVCQKNIKELSLAKTIINGREKRFSALRRPFRRSLELKCGTRISLSNRRSALCLLEAGDKENSEAINFISDPSTCRDGS